MPKLTKKQRRERRKRKNAERTKRAPVKGEKFKEKAQPWVPVKMKMFAMPQVISPEVPREKRLEIIRNIGIKAKEDFNAKYPTIEKWFKDYDALYILSFCAYYFASHPEGIDPEATGQLKFYYHYLEIMQAFALYQDRSYIGKPLFDKAETLQKEMQEIGELMSLRLLDIPFHLNSDEEIEAYHLRTQMMVHTTAVRNWAYFHQMNKVVFDLARLIGPDFQVEYNIHPLTLLKLLLKLTEERNDLLNNHRDKMRSCLKANNYQEVIDAYNRAFPENKKIQGDEIELMWERVGKNKKNLIGMLLCHSDLKLENIYSFSLDHAESLLEEKVDKGILQRILSQLSHQFEELKDFDKKHIILDNPVLRKPFIKIDDNNFYSAIWGVIPHLLLDILENFIWEHEGLRKKYSDVKSKYLEDEIFCIFSNGFPNASIYQGSIWHDPETEKDFENDLLVIIDSFAIIVEAKSGSISDPARRGAPERLYKTLRELIEDPSEQALRFVNFLKKNKGKHSFSTKRGVSNMLDNSKINYYIPLGVTLSHLGTIGSNLKKIIKAGVVEKKLEELAPSISVTDLDSVFELLTPEAEKIHYLTRRREFEAHIEYEGDELDLLGFYLDNGFNIGEDEYSQQLAISMNLKSKELDPYFIASSEGISVPRPELSMSKWWKDLLKTISHRKTDGWIETSFILLNTTKEDQEKFEKAFEKLKLQIRKGKVDKPHNWLVFVSGPEKRQYVIIGYPYTKTDKELRNNIMSQALEDEVVEKSRGVVIIGVNIDRNDYPYSVLARRLSTDLFDTLTLYPKKEN